MSMASGDVVMVERRGPVLSVTMNRPNLLNVFDEQLADGLLAAFADVAEDRSVRAVVLSGAGRSFMAGGDLSRFHANLDRAPETASLLIDRFHRLLRLIKAMPQPVIAAVQGPVAGGGVALAMGCDLVIAAENASFLSAYTRLGTSPDGGMTWSLTRLLGPRLALDFILGNETLDAGAALRLGMVNAVVPGPELAQAALAKAERLARGSTQAVAAVKRLVQAASLSDFDAQLDREKQGFVESAGTRDFREGVRAFFERRPPDFTAEAEPASRQAADETSGRR